MILLIMGLLSSISQRDLPRQIDLSLLTKPPRPEFSNLGFFFNITLSPRQVSRVYG
jgi:hypothetical protein